MRSLDGLIKYVEVNPNGLYNNEFRTYLTERRRVTDDAPMPKAVTTRIRRYKFDGERIDGKYVFEEQWD